MHIMQCDGHGSTSEARESTSEAREKMHAQNPPNKFNHDPEPYEFNLKMETLQIQPWPQTLWNQIEKWKPYKFSHDPKPYEFKLKTETLRIHSWPQTHDPKPYVFKLSAMAPNPDFLWEMVMNN